MAFFTEHPVTECVLFTETKNFTGRGHCGIIRMAFTVAIMYGIEPGEVKSIMEVDDYEGRWCFQSMAEARESFKNWDGVGDPPGDWIKHKGWRGEYRNPKIKSKYE